MSFTIGYVELPKMVYLAGNPTGDVRFWDPVAANGVLGEAPETVNADPENGGWFAKVKISDPAQYEALMDRPAYEAFLQTQ